MMQVATIQGLIDRRILVNFQLDPDRLQAILPKPFRPLLVNGVGLGGICLIRLRQARPQLWPALLGISSENAAHRIAVEWDERGQRRRGVYIPRRDTSSRLNTLIGGALFPGIHHHARFDVHEDAGFYSVALDSDDRRTHVAVEGRLASDLPPTSVFHSLSEASAFFAEGSIGYSATARTGAFEGLELRTFGWKIEPLAVQRVESSFFEDEALFPPGTMKFDSALIMLRVEHEWHRQPALCVQGAV
jgi:hypothetical protein